MKSLFILPLLMLSAILTAAALPADLDSKGTIYDFTVTDALGSPVSLSQYDGQVLLIINVANKCMLTKQYKEIQEVYEQYNEQGLTVLAFPSASFSPEGKDSEAFKQSCARKFAITFPIFSLVSVKGKNIHPLYKYLSSKDLNKIMDAPVKMNFQKYLIGRDGKIIESFSPRTSVKDKKMTAAIEAALVQTP
jgi:glutathione peroxidase